MKFLKQISAIIESFQKQDKDPQELFHEIVGYEDIKKAFFLFMTSKNKINILLAGPPGCAKTLFLLALRELKDAVFMDGSGTTGQGLFDDMFDRKHVTYLLIDEVDGLKRSDQKTLLNLFETGILTDTKVKNKKETGNATRERQFENLKVFATCNDSSRLIKAFRSRFVILELKEYEEQEFLDIAQQLYPRKDPMLIEYIAKATWFVLQTKDIRDFQKIAEVADTPEKADMLIELQLKYSKPKEAEK